MENVDVDETRSVVSELDKTEDTLDEVKKSGLILNGFKVDFALIGKKNGKSEEVMEEECLEILAVKDGRYFNLLLSNQKAHELSTKTSNTSRSVIVIYKMLCKAAASNYNKKEFNVEISDEAIIKFTFIVRVSYSEEPEKDSLEIPLEEEHLEPLQLNRRILKSSSGLNKICLTVFNNLLDHSEKVQQDMATKSELANLEESLQGSIREAKSSTVQAETVAALQTQLNEALEKLHVAAETIETLRTNDEQTRTKLAEIVTTLSNVRAQEQQQAAVPAQS